MARSLVDELERQGRGRVTFANPGTRDTLIREFKDRLDGAPDPDKLFKNWWQNLDAYIKRAGGGLQSDGSLVWARAVPARAK
jgi:hypothetical protein